MQFSLRLTVVCLISWLVAQSATATYQLSTTTTDDLGMTHVTYQQSYQGVTVFGGELKWHHRPASDERFVTGQISRSIAATTISTIPTISADAAATSAQALAGQTTEVLATQLYLFNERLLNKHKPDQTILVWEVELYQTNPFYHQYHYMDAHSGALVYQIQGAPSAINRQIYDCSYNDGNCYIDALDGTTGYTYGRSEGQTARGANPLNPNFFLSILNDTDDLYDALGRAHDYYTITFGRNGANHQGGMGDGFYYPTVDTVGLTYIDYSDSLIHLQACPNAFFDGIGSMHYCEGYVTNDITGHEYAHAVNYFSVLDGDGNPSGLAYTNEIGALNEANSDVFGEALEYYITGASDWLMGEHLSTGALRSMSDPTSDSYLDDLGNSVPYPDRYNSPNLYCGDSDDGGVHYNSSVINKAAYLIAEGGSFNGCTITGLGREKEEAIFYRAQTTYYTTTTDFNQAYTALLAACADLYDSTDCAEVAKALQAVELDQAGYCSGETALAATCNLTPTVTSADSTTADGYYKAGTSIAIDLTFSEAVSGEITVNLETGTTDRSCAVTVDAANTASCTYIVQAGDTTTDLTVSNIAGTLTDAYGASMATTTPLTNLAANKAIVIDTTAPTMPNKLQVYTSPRRTKRIKTINPRTYHKVLKAKTLRPYFTWAAVSDAQRYYVKFSDHKITVNQLRQSKNRRSTRALRGKIEQQQKKHYLYMLLQDRAGNRSAKLKLLTYKIDL